MAKSNLLKDAIADAKAVRETAIANAKIALEEAFTPRLQSVLSQRLQKEIEGEEEETFDDEMGLEEEYGAEDAPTGDSSSIGAGKGGTESGTSGKQPSGIATDAHTDLDPETSSISAKPGTEDDNVTVVREGEGEDENGDGVIDDPTGATVTEDEEFTGGEFEDEDELDLEAIIRELEGDLEGGNEFGSEEEFPTDGIEEDDEFGDEPEAEFGDAPVEELPTDGGIEEDDEFGAEAPVDQFAQAPQGEEEIDLDEILREMGYGSEEEEEFGDETVPADEFKAKEAELGEAYKVIRQLKNTINEVNLLNAKLLYSNKIFRSYELNNEQKMKVIETLDRTNNVREVKLVFATLAESLKLGNTNKKQKRKISESFASNVVKSTAPSKEIITESNEMAKRFKKLAGLKG